MKESRSSGLPVWDQFNRSKQIPTQSGWVNTHTDVMNIANCYGQRKLYTQAPPPFHIQAPSHPPDNECELQRLTRGPNHGIFKIFKTICHPLHSCFKLCFVAYWAKLWTTARGLGKDMLTRGFSCSYMQAQSHPSDNERELQRLTNHGMFQSFVV